MFYKIISKSGLIDSQSIKFDLSKEYTLEFMSNSLMGSSIQVIIYYITEDGEIVSDKVHVKLDINLPNYVSFDPN